MSSDKWIVGGAVAIITALIGIGIYFTLVEQEEWNAFAAQHNCKVIGHIKASVATGVSSSGNAVTVTTPSRTTYKCDDGATYTR